MSTQPLPKRGERKTSSKEKADVPTAIKHAARRLFSSKGVDRVTLREIAAAAGQKNHRAVGYYFGSKEELIREIILDGATLIDTQRNHMLDAIESKGGPTDVREIVDALIFPAVALNEDGRKEDSYFRFMNLLVTTHREFIEDILASRWNSGYQRCIDYFRELMPEMPLPAQNQRLLFIRALFGEVMEIRETMDGEPSAHENLWMSDTTLEHLSLVITYILQSPLDSNLAEKFHS